MTFQTDLPYNRDIPPGNGDYFVIVVFPDGKKDEKVSGRLESLILWLLENREKISSGHKTVALECHGDSVEPSITEHFKPIR